MPVGLSDIGVVGTLSRIVFIGKWGRNHLKNVFRGKWEDLDKGRVFSVKRI